MLWFIVCVSAMLGTSLFDGANTRREMIWWDIIYYISKMLDFMDERLKECIQQALDIISETPVPKELKQVSFEFINNSGNNIATNYEWAEITSFFSHIESGVNFTPDSDNLKEKAKLVLNEMRPVLFNKSDSIHYEKIMNIIKQMINGNHKTKTIINAVDSDGNYINKEYIQVLRTLERYIEATISKSDFDYVCNRLLQHSDLKYQERFLQDHRDGAIPYILIKNAIIASCIANLLYSYLQPLLMFNVVGVRR